MDAARRPSPPPVRRERLYALLVALALALVVAGTLARAPGSAEGEGEGRPRNIDVDRVLQLVRGGQLSDHEADFYRALATPPGEAGGRETRGARGAPDERGRPDVR